MKPQDRFFSEGQCYFGPSDFPLTETHCNVWDWDQLRMVKVKGTAKLFPRDEDLEIPIMAQFADSLAPDVRAVMIDDNGLLAGVSTDPEEDDTPFVAYLPVSVVDPLAECRTIQYSRLQELGRLGPGVDLSTYKDERGILHKVAFKFNILNKPLSLQMAWDELNLLKRLPPHPNILPLDSIVLDDTATESESRVLGFTTKYISFGTIEDNTNVPFRFEWLQQLTQLVDFLNLELGVMHQDIAPRNLLIDPNTNKILLFDFDRAAHGKNRLLEGRDDVSAVVFTVYELITNDTHFTSIPHWKRTIDMVQSIPEWTRTRALDTHVSKFRNYLNDWVAKRKSDGDVDRYLNAPYPLTWPDLPTPPEYEVPYELGKKADGQPRLVTGPRSRRTALEMGQYCFRWERPPLRKAMNGAKCGMH